MLLALAAFSANPCAAEDDFATVKEEVGKTLSRIINTVKGENWKELASRVVYYGPNEDRQMKSSLNPEDPEEFKVAKETGGQIKGYLNVTEEYRLNNFFISEQNLTDLPVCETVFEGKDRKIYVIFAFIEVNDEYLLMDVDEIKEPTGFRTHPNEVLKTEIRRITKFVSGIQPGDTLESIIEPAGLACEDMKEMEAGEKYKKAFDLCQTQGEPDEEGRIARYWFHVTKEDRKVFTTIAHLSFTEKDLLQSRPVQDVVINLLDAPDKKCDFPFRGGRMNAAYWGYKPEECPLYVPPAEFPDGRILRHLYHKRGRLMVFEVIDAETLKAHVK
jgi:hypothetical protein